MVIKQECFFLVDVAWTYTAGVTAKVLISNFKAFVPPFGLTFRSSSRWGSQSDITEVVGLSIPRLTCFASLHFVFSNGSERGQYKSSRRKKASRQSMSGGIINPATSHVQLALCQPTLKFLIVCISLLLFEFRDSQNLATHEKLSNTQVSS